MRPATVSLNHAGLRELRKPKALAVLSVLTSVNHRTSMCRSGAMAAAAGDVDGSPFSCPSSFTDAPHLRPPVALTAEPLPTKEAAA